MMSSPSKSIIGLISVLMLVACGDDTQSNPAGSPLDQRLRSHIVQNGLTGDHSQGRNLPAIQDPLPQLGMKLFFSKSLGGDFDSACVSCHHPGLGGADGLSLPVGVAAIFEDLLGPGREHRNGAPLVPRNAPSSFNAGLWDHGMFLDSRVESLNPTSGSNGASGSIRTPDTPFGIADDQAGRNLPAAQAAFPVTSEAEMRGDIFEAGQSNAMVREHLAARIGSYGVGSGELSNSSWLAEFQSAFVSSQAADELINFDNIALAIGEYERSQTFVDNAWKAYVDGDLNAISLAAKRGADVFYTPANQGGGNCFVCHRGDFFTDEQHHTIAMPQIGPGKGDGQDDDFGRERETGNINDRYRFRTPSLLNVALTAPYGHAGAYANLQQLMQHYNNPNATVEGFFEAGAWCQLDQFQDLNNCANLYPNARQNSELALNKLDQERRGRPSNFPNLNLNPQQQQDVIAFLNSLTDRCLTDASCIADWIPARDGGLDGHQLNAVDQRGNPR
jgi:cytochrome c peroxidase